MIFTTSWSVMIPHTKGVTQVEYQMKKLELQGVVERCGVREWVKL